jgi:di/tricarboxylate transporter
MANKSDEPPTGFAKWMGVLLALALVGMALLILLAKIGREVKSSKEIENNSGSVSTGGNSPVPSDSFNNKRFNF